MSVVVVLHPASGPDALARALRALHRHTPAAVGLLLAPASDAVRGWVEGLALPRELVWLGDGPAGTVWNAAAAAAGRADLALVDAATEVGPGWLDGLQAALASGGGTVATATALATQAAFLSVPERNLPWSLLPPETELADAAVAVSAASLGLAPPVPLALPHLCLVARAALDVAGPFDPLDAADALAAFAARCAERGLRHVAADAVLAIHRGPAPSGELWDPGLGATVRDAHPWLPGAIRDAATDRFSPLGRALLIAAGALRPRTVTLDARGLVGELTGTKLHIAALAAALAEREDVKLRLLVPDEPSGPAANVLAGLAVRQLRAADVAGGVERTDVVHRPWGVDDPADLALLDAVGERLLVTQHDLIGFGMPSAFGTAEAWAAHRAAVAAGLAAAAVVLAPSAHAAAGVVAAGLASDERVRSSRTGPTAPGRPRSRCGRRDSRASGRSCCALAGRCRTSSGPSRSSCLTHSGSVTGGTVTSSWPAPSRPPARPGLARPDCCWSVRGSRTPSTRCPRSTRPGRRGSTRTRSRSSRRARSRASASSPSRPPCTAARPSSPPSPRSPSCWARTRCSCPGTPRQARPPCCRSCGTPSCARRSRPAPPRTVGPSAGRARRTPWSRPTRSPSGSRRPRAPPPRKPPRWRRRATGTSATASTTPPTTWSGPTTRSSTPRSAPRCGAPHAARAAVASCARSWERPPALR